MTTIQLHNTKTRRKDTFAPIDPTNVRMYVCGPTVYDRAHLGNARPVVVFDTLFRLLRHTYGANHVTYVRNFTDVDDKINATALARKEAGADGTLVELIAERTNETIGWYHADMDAVGALRPSKEPRATAYIEEMKSMIQELLDAGVAYVAAATIGHNSGAMHVYLDSERVPSHAFLSVNEYDENMKEQKVRYGELSGRSLDEMISGSRAEVGEGKRNPMDSVLWKPSTIEEPGWESPWGYGRPGWHIECSAMSRKELGARFDIHGGGLDLMFPHHENELAQCRACDGADASAQIWMHNEMLQVEGKKMSKSLGNFFTVRDLLDQGVPGEVIRFVMLQTHYRKPMDWTEKKRQEAEATLRKWRALTNAADNNGKPDVRVVEAIANDLNTSGAIATLHELAKEILEKQRHKTTDQEVADFAASARLLGLLDDDANMGSWVFDGAVEQLMLDPWAEKLAKLRVAAMETKDFSAVDALKSALMDAGVEVRMSKAGVELLPGAGFDATKLEGL